MELLSDFDPVIVNWVIFPILIFIARLLDVSIGTLRIVFISKGDMVTAPILGFFEVLIWIVAMGQVMNNLTSPMAYFAWAGGFAVGNYLGLRIEQKLALGKVVVRVISSEPPIEMMEELQKLNYRTVILDAESGEGRMKVLFSIVNRKDLNKIILLIREKIPNAYYTIEDIQQFSDSMPGAIEGERRNWIRRIFPLKKAK